MTREEFEAILQEAYEAGQDNAYEEIEKILDEAEMFEESEEEEPVAESEEIEDIELEGMDEDAVLEALDLKKRLNNVPSPRDLAAGVKGTVAKRGSNFKKGVAAFRKRVLGKVGKVNKAASKKYDEAHKKLIKAKAKLLLKKKSL